MGKYIRGFRGFRVSADKKKLDHLYFQVQQPKYQAVNHLHPDTPETAYRLAEQDSPVAGVAYQTVEDFILVSKFRLNRPSLAEITNSQSRVVPVIDGVEDIYLLDTTVTQV